MSPPANQNPRLVALEISRLGAILAETQGQCGRSVIYLDYIKNQLLAQSNNIVDIRNRILLFHQQARSFRANNQLADHDQKVRDIAEMERLLGDKILTRDQTGVTIEKVAQEVRDMRQEIINLQNALNGLRTRGYYY